MSRVKCRISTCLLLVLFCAANAAGALTSAETWAKADQDYNARKFAEALTSYNNYYTALPTCSSGETACKLDRAKALLKIGECNYNLGKFSEARGYLDILLNSYASADSTVVAEAQYHMGACLKEEGSLTQAIAAFDKTVADFPGDKGFPSRATLTKAECQRELGEYQASIQTYFSAISTYSDKPDVCRQAKEGITQTVMASGKAGGYTATIAALNKAMTDHASDAELCANLAFWKGKFQHESLRYSSAVTTFKGLIAHYPHSREYAETCVRLGENLILAMRMQEASDHLAPLLSDAKFSHEEKGRMTLFMGISNFLSLSKSEEWYTKVINDFGDTKFDREAYYLRAIVRIKRQDYPEAMQDIEMIKQPLCWVHHATGRYWLAKGDYAKAAESLAQVLPSLPDPTLYPLDVPVDTLKRLAECYDKTGNTVKAAEARTQLTDFRALYCNVDRD